MTDCVQRMIDYFLEWPTPILDVASWFPGSTAYLVDRCTQCARYLPESQRPDPNLSRPGVLFCDECARMQR